jgi:cysteinyl-tRNA synthetase
MSLTLYNTATREKVPFIPGDPARVTMYVCGPTVYNYAHIGNARAAVVFDLLYRVLKVRYPEVIYARNITDVDDKINAAAKDQGVPIGQITEAFTAAYLADMEALGVLPPVKQPRVTDNIPAILAMIERLIATDHAYEVEGHVLFNVPSFAGYGQLSGRNRDDQVAGARVEVAPFKRDPADFVLWKPSTVDQPGWESPWGRGRPGWHIECSAMVEQHLGETIDIHGGGLDLIFPHHENEVAQGTCAHGGVPYCRYWIHNGFVTVDEEKMSKSLGNVLLARDLLKEAPGEAIRYALLAGHYRHPINWTDEGLHQAKANLDRLYGALKRCEGVDVTAADLVCPPAFNEALEDDLNTPQALTVLHQVARALNSTEEMGEIRRLKGQLLACGGQMGFLTQAPAKWLMTRSGAALDEARINALVAVRNAARKDKDFAAADRIRAELLSLHGVDVLDRPGGTSEWRVVAGATGAPAKA